MEKKDKNKLKKKIFPLGSNTLKDLMVTENKKTKKPSKQADKESTQEEIN